MANLLRRNMPRMVAALTGAVLMVPARMLFPAPATPPPPTPDPQDCVTLKVLTASYKESPILDLIGMFQDTRPRLGDGRCIRVVAQPETSGGTATDLLTGNDVDADVWLPASSAWVDILREQTGKEIVPPKDEIESVVHSYQVIAMPQAVAKHPPINWSDDPVNNSSISWKRLHDELAVAGSFRFGKSNPNFSTSGLYATAGAFVAAKVAVQERDHVPADERSPLTEADFDDPTILSPFVSELENSVLYYADTSLELLPNVDLPVLQGRPRVFSAVSVQEVSVLQHNFRETIGKAGDKGCPDKTPALVAMYPDDFTVKTDQPYVILQWTQGDKRQAARKFEEFLRSADAIKRFLDWGFRRKGVGKECLFKRENGVDVDPADTHPPDPNILLKVRDAWPGVRKTARVLILIDTSVTPGDQIEQAKQAVIASLDYFRERDAFQVWSFPSRDPTKAFDKVVVDKALGGVKARIEGITARSGDSHLYETLAAALTEVERNADPDVIDGIILLTGGVDEPPSDLTPQTVADKIRRANLDSEVFVFPIAYGDHPDYEGLKMIGEYSLTALVCLNPDAYARCERGPPRQIDEVFADVVRNF